MIYDESIKLVLYNFIPNKSSLNQIVDAMKKNLGQSKTDMDKLMNFNIEEEYQSKIIGQDNLSATATYNLLINLVGKTESSAVNWLKSNGVSYKVEYKTITDGSAKNGIVLSQSFPANKRIDLINGTVTIEVAKVETIVTPTPTPSEPETPTTPSEETNTEENNE